MVWRYDSIEDDFWRDSNPNPEIWWGFCCYGETQVHVSSHYLWKWWLKILWELHSWCRNDSLCQLRKQARWRGHLLGAVSSFDKTTVDGQKSCTKLVVVSLSNQIPHDFQTKRVWWMSFIWGLAGICNSNSNSLLWFWPYFFPSNDQQCLWWIP